MSEGLWRKAEELAGHPYVVKVLKDETTDGEPIFVAFNPELPGCRSQGKTREEAIENLAQARIDFIYALLEDGLCVPDPADSLTETKDEAKPIHGQFTYQTGIGDIKESSTQVDERLVPSRNYSLTDVSTVP